SKWAFFSSLARFVASGLVGGCLDALRGARISADDMSFPEGPVMPLPAVLRDRLRLPVIGSPLFIVSGPELVIAQCKAGIVGSFPALNARPLSQLDEWLHEITEALAAHDRAHPESPAAPFAVNQIVHKSNTRLEQDMELAVKWK